MHAREIPAFERYAREAHAHETQARAVHAHEVHAGEVHAHEMHAHKVQAYETPGGGFTTIQRVTRPSHIYFSLAMGFSIVSRVSAVR